ncbi:lpg0008 family Dot/Icm T4SS effector [Legionella quateirensis]|uniref:Uncharacterized protein n=1 Tax=Legionella quateirensis TaxID=45072 RepID=A0A378KWN7_9GAMM|nr:lpg0008 family Dot/Icm T4SS effector [Legionella quateirensis]KTD44848.1 hypothetical protein Lqua_2683 [Legionella quateirensis]STY16230.1 Uncharacterised protein [Legionella quateirensis]
MGYSLEEIQGLQNPYKDLGNGDALAEHREGLNQLSAEQKKDLATRMVLDCPQTELKSFGRVIEAARVPHADHPTFYSVLFEAYEVKRRIYALLDSRNKNPHLLILDKEFDEELFNKYKDLALQVLDTNETAIAERLAETTPEESRNQVALNVKGIFPDTLFARKIGQAFALKRDIDRLLLGDNPNEFFSSREYSVDSCQEFSGLFKVTKNKESSIAAKLALSAPQEKQSIIARNIQNLVPTDDEFATKVRTAFTVRRNIDLLLGDKPEQFFTSRDFSVDNCLEFSILFPALLEGHEQSIGEKLSLLESKTLSDINRKLEMINGAAHDQTNPFRLIAAAIVPKQGPSQQQEPTVDAPKAEPASSTSSNPNTIFQSVLKKRPTELTRSPTLAQSSMDSDSDSDSEDEDCFSKCCNMFK